MTDLDGVVRSFMTPPYPYDPYPLYARIRRRPVFQEPDGSYVVCGYTEVSALLRDPRLSADPVNSPAPVGPGFSFLNMDPPQHDRLRRMTMRHFGPPNDPGRVEAMRPHLLNMATSLIDALKGCDEVDLVADVAYPLPVTAVAGIAVGGLDDGLGPDMELGLVLARHAQQVGDHRNRQRIGYVGH